MNEGDKSELQTLIYQRLRVYKLNCAKSHKHQLQKSLHKQKNEAINEALDRIDCRSVPILGHGRSKS